MEFGRYQIHPHWLRRLILDRTHLIEGPAPPLSERDGASLITQYLKHVARPMVQVNSSQVALFGVSEFSWYISENTTSHWNEPSGEELCIIDLDNRPFNETGQIFANETMSWENATEVHGLSVGILNHWLYARIHGYKYYYVHVDQFEDRRTNWKKTVVIPEILKKHKTCVYLDSDAIFSHLDLPFEWLMNHWNIDPQKDVLSLAVDPEADFNRDERNNLYLNTGFIIAQNTSLAHQILQDWRECPDDGGKYPDCPRFRNPPIFLSDQGAFGTYIRYDYPENIKELPCAEANGYRDSQTECMGTFVQHLWTGKNTWIKLSVGQQLPGDFLQAFHRQFMSEKEQFWMTEQELMGTDSDVL